MWRVMRHGRTIGALTLDGSGGREHHKVESFGAGDGTKRDGGGEAMWKGRRRRESIMGDEVYQLSTEPDPITAAPDYGWGQTNKI
jgi:hypothetical protein